MGFERLLLYINVYACIRPYLYAIYVYFSIYSRVTSVARILACLDLLPAYRDTSLC